jgi:hypothetical protein
MLSRMMTMMLSMMMMMMVMATVLSTICPLEYRTPIDYSCFLVKAYVMP